MENSFQTIGWEKYGLFQTPFLKYQDDYDMPSCRYGNGEMMNGDVYEKLHIVS